MDPVASTALWTAADRGRESARPDHLFVDPWADALAGEEGRALMERMDARFPIPGGSPVMAIRTRYLDDALLDAVAGSAIRQVVLVAAGMDTRAYRLSWPDDVTVYEVDRPAVLAHKESVLADAGAKPMAAARVGVGVDLVGLWTTELLSAGLRVDEPTVWVAEGLCVYLAESEVAALLDVLWAHSAPGSQLLVDIVGRSTLDFPFFADWFEALRAEGAPWRFATDTPESFLAEHGWDATTVVRFGEDEANFGRLPSPVPPRDTPGYPQTFVVTARRSA